MRTDRPRRRFRPRCLALGMILAWIIALYVPKFVIAAAGVVNGPDGVLATTWYLTDQVEISAKVALALLTTTLLLAARLVPLGPQLRLFADALLGTAAMLLLLALLPASWSDGIGIGLTGRRFDPMTLPAYLVGGFLAGLAYSLADQKCGELTPPD
jgi:hypothetical protein